MKIIKNFFIKKKYGNYIDQLNNNFRDILNSYENIDHGKQLNIVDAFFAYRLFFGRNPNLTDELPKILSDKQTYREFISNVLKSPEFRGFFPPNKELMAELTEGLRFWFNSSDREMGVSMAHGLYEPESVELMKKIIRPGMNCLDIGAQSGYYTCLMASIVGENGKVYAFEPMPSNYKLLVKNIEENKFQNRVKTYQIACSNEKRTMEARAVSNMYVLGKVDGGEKVTVNTTRLDDVINERIDVIKIDIEGHEPAAIEGMKSIIQRDRPIIMSEINEYWLRTCSNSSGNKFVEILNSLGYEVFNVMDTEKPISASSLKLDILDKIDVVAYSK